MKEKHSFLPVDPVLRREIYFENRKISLEQFRSNLKEPKNKFAIWAIFIRILEQERFVEYITKTKHEVAKPKDEEKFLELLTNEAKVVFGKEYDKLYKDIKNERENLL